MAVFSNTKNSELSLVLDIGSSSVGGSLVLFGPKHSPHIVYTKRMPLIVPQTPLPEQLRHNILEVLDTFFEEIVSVLPEIDKKYKKNKIEHIYCSYSALWYDTFLQKVEIQKDQRFKLSKNMIDDLVKSEEKKLIRSYAEKKKIDVNDICTLETQVIRGTINGYAISSIEGKMAKNVSFSLATTCADCETILSVEKKIHKAFHTRKISRNSSIISLYSNIMDLYPDMGYFVWLHITGEVTEVVRVSDEILYNRETIPFGRNALIRGVSKSFDVPISVASSYLRMYLSGGGEEIFITEMNRVLESIEAEWNIYLKESLEESFKEEAPNSSSLFVFVSQDVAPFFEDALKDFEFSAVPMNFEVLLANELTSYYSIDKGVVNDDYIVFHTIFINKMLHG